MSLFRFGFTASSSASATEDTPTRPTLPNYLPQASECGLGVEEHSTVTAFVSQLANPEPEAKKRKTKGNYTHYSDEDRAKIGKYATENGNERARKRFLTKFPHLTESTVRSFKKRYLEKMETEKKKANPQPVTSLPNNVRGRPPILLELDGKLIKYLKTVRAKGGVVNIHVVRATAQALIVSNPALTQCLSRFEMPRSWVQSIYRRMGYNRRAGTTSRPPVPEGIYNECRREFLGDIYEKMTLYSIPPELVLNADQTPSSYVSVGKMTMAAKGVKSVPVQGLTDKRNITLTFVVTFKGDFLPMQVIYGGKTKASLPRGFVFPKGFSLSQNPKHWSNEKETLKLIQEVVNPYVVHKRKELGLHSTQKALMVWDVFKGQMTEAVKNNLASLNIELVPVPANLTHLFQPLDLTVNGAAKKFIKKEFITYYSSIIQQQLESGKKLEDINIDMRLTIVKPLHAQWLVNTYNSSLGLKDGK